VADGPATVAQIARTMGLARQSVQRVADLLEQDGLTAYETNPSHRRAQIVRVTPRGLRTLRTIQETQRAWADDVASEIGEADLRKANEVVGRLLRALSARRRMGRENRTP
jgi:DNA-binding MarR family transcriptional regulator